MNDSQSDLRERERERERLLVAREKCDFLMEILNATDFGCILNVGSSKL